MVRKETLTKLKNYIEELKTIKVEQVASPSKFLTIEPAIYHLNNGKTMKRELLKKQAKDGSAAIILPVTNENKTVLVVEPRLGSTRTVAVGLPAGYIEPGEEPLNAAKRELAEETGYVCGTYRLLSKYYQDPGISKAYNYAYLGLDAEHIKTQSLDPEEFIRFLKCDYEEALELVELGYIEDLQAQFVLEKAKQYLLKR
ncbi:MAG: NUDIX hydrolase [Bacilli bacterium]|nr:NUDIX hydrolase [Bacilli bacterium]